PESWRTIILQIRLPRITLAGFVGASLALSGGTYQGLFRNPLADPYLIGVASGAGLGASIVLLTGFPTYAYSINLLPIVAFIGAVSAVSASYVIARQSSGLSLTSIILSGVAVGSFANAITSYLIIRSTPDVKPLLAWLMGGFIGATWNDVLTIIPYFLIGSVIILIYARILNLFQIDQSEIKQLGVNVEMTKVILIAAAALMASSAVALSGLIGFVGLIAPHAVRLIWGYDQRVLLPMSMLVGAGFMIITDMFARIVISPSELPVGVITAFLGAPLFLYLLRSRRRMTL
ncbi:iron chelate uptake ABC transporter family permease subunit, partial [SAR202 cluster bacterium AC-409-J13_OGT_754m]|nr:iron chelate uptake ABC transporter family permease subunit [SAR202 cluster bacterium AC-409-J13_OGT_754m]